MRQYWQTRFSVFRYDHSTARPQFENSGKYFQWLRGAWDSHTVEAEVRYREFQQDLVQNYAGYEWARGRYDRLGRRYKYVGGLANAEGDSNWLAASAAPAQSLFLGDKLALAESLDVKQAAGEPREEPGGKAPDLSHITARKNLNETAFFFPQLISDGNGIVKLEFTMPEALTQWRFMGFAHDRNLRSGFLEGETVTSKDLMVQPNPPRFVREGDVIEFTVKISNQSAAEQTGKIRLTFNLAQTDAPADKQLANGSPELSCDVPSKESRSYSWRIKVPDGLGFLTYKAVAATGKISDGEEGFLQV